jgi:uncharacterized protein (TIRG00374 family)
MARLSRKALQLFLFIAGLFLFGWTIHAVGVDDLSALLPTLAQSGLLFAVVYPLMCAWDTAAWHVLFPKNLRQKIPFLKLYSIRLAGQAVNNITPFVDIGGEFLKVSLAQRHLGVPFSSAVSTVVLARSWQLFAEIFLWMTGLSLAWFYFNPSYLRHGGIFAGIGVFLIFCWVLFLVQKRGFFATFLKKEPSWMKEVDDEIASYYDGRRWQLVFCFLLTLTGWLVGGLEMWVFFRILGNPISLVEGVMFEGLLQVIRSLSFFIPGNLGSQEAGLALAAGSLGLGPAVGVGVSLLKRLRQLCWTAVGFGIWGVFQWQEQKSTS